MGLLFERSVQEPAQFDQELMVRLVHLRIAWILSINFYRKLQGDPNLVDRKIGQMS